jgi:hypothetical protein
MRRFAVLAGLVAVAVAGGVAQGQKTVPELSKIAADFGAAVTAGNAAKVTSFYTADATFMPPNEAAIRGLVPEADGSGPGEAHALTNRVADLR